MNKKEKTATGSLFFVKSEDNLLDFDFCADSFELSLESFGIFLGNAFLDLGVLGLDESLCLSKAEPGDGADFLNDLDLLSAELVENDVKLGLLFNNRAGSCDSGAGSNSSSGNTEGVFQCMNELRKLENGQSLDLFDHSSDFFAHDNILQKILIVILQPYAQKEIVGRLSFCGSFLAGCFNRAAFLLEDLAETYSQAGN